MQEHLRKQFKTIVTGRKMGLGAIGDGGDLPNEHAIKTKRFIEHFKAVVQKSRTKKD